MSSKAGYLKERKHLEQNDELINMLQDGNPSHWEYAEHEGPASKYESEQQLKNITIGPDWEERDPDMNRNGGPVLNGGYRDDTWGWGREPTLTGSSTQKSIGEFLQTAGGKMADVWDNPMVERMYKVGGKVIGKFAIPIPVVGSYVGGQIAENLPKISSYASGLIGEIGGAMAGNRSTRDVLEYIPTRIWEDVKNETINHPVVQVITGDLNWRDAIVDRLEQEAMVDIFTDKTHAWKDKDGNYHKRYVDGATMVVGKWEEPKNVMPTPDLSSNAGILGTHNGEIYYKGFDDARWAALQANKK